METICQGKRVILPVETTLASVHMRKKVDPICPSQQRSPMLWLSRLDPVDPAERAKVFTAISRKVVGKKARDNPERYSGWFWVQCSSKKFERMAREAMDICLRQKECNKSMFDGLQCQEQCIDHIPYYLSGLSLGSISAVSRVRCSNSGW